ncbi:hypothetical protein FQ038_08990, partial [Escherichia coli]|nr:hypothetical protein [Escherichia coli]
MSKKYTKTILSTVVSGVILASSGARAEFIIKDEGYALVKKYILEFDNRIEGRTTVGVNSDGSLTRAEGAKKTMSVNDGLLTLSGRTDRIDAAVG